VNGELDLIHFIKKQLKTKELFKVLATKEQRNQVKQLKLFLAVDKDTE
jgi:hypothetical protein